MEITEKRAKTLEYLDKGMVFLFAFMILLIPLVFSSQHIDAFNLSKVTFFRMSILIMLGIWIIKIYIAKEIYFRRTELDFPVIMYLLIISLATLFSVNSFHSFWGQHMYRFEGMAAIAGYGILFFTVTGNLNNERLKLLSSIVVYGCIPVMIYGFLQFNGFEMVQWQASSSSRIWSSFGNPNFFAGYIVMIVPLILGLIYSSKGIKRLFLFLLLISSVVCLMLTFSRSGFIGLVAGVYAFLYLTGAGKRRIYLNISILLIVVTIIMFAFLGKHLRNSGVESLNKNLGLTNKTVATFISRITYEDASIKARIKYMKVGLKMLKERPVLGMGPDTFSILWRKYMTKDLSFLIGNRLANPGYAHSEIFQAMATTGIAGFLVYIYLMFKVFRNGLRNALIKGENSVFNAAIVSSIVAIFVNNQFSFHSPVTAVFMWLFISSIAVMGNSSVRRVALNSKIWIPLQICGAVIVVIALVLSYKIYSADGFFSKGLYFEGKKMYEIAISNYESAVKTFPYEQTYYQNLGKIYLNRAEETFDKEQKMKFLKKAVNNYEKHLLLIPQDALSWNGLGIAFMNMAMQDNSDNSYLVKAEEVFNKSIEYAPVFLEPYINLGSVLYNTKRKENAMEVYRKALAIDSREPLIYFNLGNMCAQEGDMEKAMSYWQDALDLNPGYVQARQNIELNKQQEVKTEKLRRESINN